MKNPGEYADKLEKLIKHAKQFDDGIPEEYDNELEKWAGRKRSNNARQSPMLRIKLLPISCGFRRSFVLLLVISGAFAITFCGVKRKYLRSTSDKTYQDATQLIQNGGMLLDIPGCKIPLLDPFDKSIKHLLKTPQPIICPGKPSPIVSVPNGTLILNLTVLKIHYNVPQEKINCHYQAVFRLDPQERSRENHFIFQNKTKLQFGVPVPHDLLVVGCAFGHETLLQYIAVSPLKPQVEMKKSSLIQEPAELSVIILGIDSVSSLNFMRYFKKTYQFLRENLSPFEFKGYVKVGDNTFPNLLPMLTGHFMEYYWNETVRNTMFFDNIDLIWKKYSDIGHRTFYAEDSPYYGTFNFGKRGFKNIPTDYYYRPLALAIEESQVKKKSATYCINSQLEADIIYKYLQNFIATMGQRPFFAFAMVSTLTHGNLTHATYADEPTYRVLKYIWETGALNNSLLVFFSDHGVRFGPITKTYLGKFEERMPFMFLNFPKWFLQKYPEYAENLRINQHRLTTPFDIHATLAHLLNTTGNMKGKQVATPHGLSLMGAISENRTCEKASILPHWCPCLIYQSVPVTERTVINAANIIIKGINEQLKPFQNHCAPLQLDRITDARSGEPNENVLKFLRHQNNVMYPHPIYGNKVQGQIDYLITLKVKPSGGVFEGTVRREITTNISTMQSIRRIDEYTNQSACIQNQLVRKFCFCVS